MLFITNDTYKHLLQHLHQTMLIFYMRMVYTMDHNPGASIVM